MTFASTVRVIRLALAFVVATVVPDRVPVLLLPEVALPNSDGKPLYKFGSAAVERERLAVNLGTELCSPDFEVSSPEPPKKLLIRLPAPTKNDILLTEYRNCNSTHRSTILFWQEIYGPSYS